MRILRKHVPAGPQISIETRRLKVLSFSALLQFFALEQCFDLFYIIFSWTFLEFRNWNAPKNAKAASRTDRKLCVSIQRSCDLEQKWPIFLGGARCESRFCDVICTQRYSGQFFFAHFKFEKLPTCIWRLPFALKISLTLQWHLLVKDHLSFIASVCKYYLLNEIFFRQYSLTKIRTTGYFLTNRCHIYYYYYYYYYYL